MIPTVESIDVRQRLCRIGCAEQLRDMPSEELTELVTSLLDKHKGERIDSWSLAFADPQADLFVYGGACDVLMERHEEDYVMNLVSIRKPKTFREYVKRLLTGEYPKVERKDA